MRRYALATMSDNTSGSHGVEHVVVARRTRLHGERVDQYLCLSRGSDSAYRVYTVEGETMTECLTDIASAEFDLVSDEALQVFLIESFWRLKVSRQMIESCLRKVAAPACV